MYVHVLYTTPHFSLHAVVLSDLLITLTLTGRPTVWSISILLISCSLHSDSAIEYNMVDSIGMVTKTGMYSYYIG